MMKFLFSYWFWIIFAVGAMLNMWHAVHMWALSNKLDPYYQDYCFNVIIQAACFLLTIYAANKERETNKDGV